MNYQVTLIISFDILWLQHITTVKSQSAPLYFCESVIYPEFKLEEINCTLTCGLHFEQHSGTKVSEIALCTRDRQNPLRCYGNEDCYKEHPGSYCKQAKCFCETPGTRHKVFTQPLTNTLSICVIPSTSLETRAAFPWKTVLAVCGALGVVALLFVGLRWIYPIMQDINQHSHQRTQWQQSDSFYPSHLSVPRETSISPQQRNYNQTESSPDDRPPSYETIQLLDVPPKYEEASAPRNIRPVNEC